MLRIFDYKCINESCPQYNIKEERYVDSHDIEHNNDKEYCEECGRLLKRCLGASSYQHPSWNKWNIL